LDGHWHSVLLALVEQLAPPAPLLEVVVPLEVVPELEVLETDPPVPELELDECVVLLPVPLLLELQAPRPMPIVQPTITPEISQPFFMIPS
jgi:hypothetical protein